MDYSKIFVCGASGNHSFNQSVLNCVNDVLGSNFQFGHIKHEKHPDDENGFCFADGDREKIKDSHVIAFGCPTDNEQEIQFDQTLWGYKQYGAKTITGVLPYIRYRRQDRVEKEHEVTRLKWYLAKLRYSGIDKLIVCDPHSVENTKLFAQELGIDLRIADPTPLVAKRFMSVVDSVGAEKVVVYSPDIGSIERAIALCKTLGVRLIIRPKERLSSDEVAVNSTNDEKSFSKKVEDVVDERVPFSLNLEDIEGMHVIVREDEVSTAGTAKGTAQLLRTYGAFRLSFYATHPVCNRGWRRNLTPHDIDKRLYDNVILGDTRPRGLTTNSYEESTGGLIEVLKMAPAVARQLIRVIEELQTSKN